MSCYSLCLHRWKVLGTPSMMSASEKTSKTLILIPSVRRRGNSQHHKSGNKIWFGYSARQKTHTNIKQAGSGAVKALHHSYIHTCCHYSSWFKFLPVSFGQWSEQHLVNESQKIFKAKASTECPLFVINQTSCERKPPSRKVNQPHT